MIKNLAIPFSGSPSVVQELTFLPCPPTGVASVWWNSRQSRRKHGTLENAKAAEWNLISLRNVKGHITESFRCVS